MRIREFEDDDADEVVALWRAAGLVRPWNDPYLDIARKKSVQRDLFLVAADDDGRILGAGMAGYDGHRGWVNYLGVLPTARRAGVGRALMAEFATRLTALGCPKLNLQVREGNDEALAFYAGLGFTRDPAVSLGKRLIADD